MKSSARISEEAKQRFIDNENARKEGRPVPKSFEWGKRPQPTEADYIEYLRKTGKDSIVDHDDWRIWHPKFQKEPTDATLEEGYVSKNPDKQENNNRAELQPEPETAEDSETVTISREDLEALKVQAVESARVVHGINPDEYTDDSEIDDNIQITVTDTPADEPTEEDIEYYKEREAFHKKRDEIIQTAHRNLDLKKACNHHVRKHWIEKGKITEEEVLKLYDLYGSPVGVPIVKEYVERKEKSK